MSALGKRRHVAAIENRLVSSLAPPNCTITSFWWKCYRSVRADPGGVYFLTLKMTFCKSASWEQFPTMISKSPGSTTYFMWIS